MPVPAQTIWSGEQILGLLI